MRCNSSNLANAQTFGHTGYSLDQEKFFLVGQIPTVQGDAARGALFSLTGILQRDAAPSLLLEQSAGNAHAQHIHPSLVEIE
jgi:hypothetical protein